MRLGLLKPEIVRLQEWKRLNTKDLGAIEQAAAAISGKKPRNMKGLERNGMLSEASYIFSIL